LQAKSKIKQLQWNQKSQVLSTKHKTLKLFLARPIKGNIIAKEGGANGTRERIRQPISRNRRSATAPN